jgi:hypothetical protein
MFVQDGKRLEVFGLQAILSRICELLKTLLKISKTLFQPLTHPSARRN